MDNEQMMTKPEDEQSEQYKELSMEEADDEERIVMESLKRKGNYKLLKAEQMPQESAMESNREGNTLTPGQGVPTATTTSQGHSNAPATGRDTDMTGKPASPAEKGAEVDITKSPLGMEIKRTREELAEMRKSFEQLVNKKVEEIMNDRKSFLKAIKENPPLPEQITAIPEQVVKSWKEKAVRAF